MHLDGAKHGARSAAAAGSVAAFLSPGKYSWASNWDGAVGAHHGRRTMQQTALFRMPEPACSTTTPPVDGASHNLMMP